ncbi:MAG: GNAT family N-acetyltransferase [Oscillochloris sp.]|nr:GNAT family N-acetyltransferase [Oscillochloris sp.]
MSIEVVDLDEYWQAPAVSYLRRSPYRNAIPLSNLTQLRAYCTVVVAHSEGMVQGVASYYRDLPFPALAFAAEPGPALPQLLTMLADRAPELREAALGTVIPQQRLPGLAACAVIETAEPETQMVAEPETLRRRDDPQVRRLRGDDLPAMAALAKIGGLVAWRDAVLTHGPAFGAFIDTQLAAMATTHFATPDVVEIGNIVTHPTFRRRGLASACTSALTDACFRLAPRVYLMVMENNSGAYEVYRGLGFWPAERFVFTSFRLRS